MPELPEVETTRRGLLPLVRGARIAALVVYDPRLRWPIPPVLSRILPGRVIHDLRRRGKYLLADCDRGTLILHLGMSGSLRVVDAGLAPGPWDAFDLVLANGQGVRLRDPRRFGALLYTPRAARHPLLAHLGPEPLEAGFDGAYLHERARGRRVAIRDFLMNTRVVAGIGNIYANESLFKAGIDPRRAAGRVARPRYEALSRAIVTVLTEAIAQGGTTLKDFSGSDGRPGYFQQALRVYGRAGAPCQSCRTPVVGVSLGGRSAYYCLRCQR